MVADVASRACCAVLVSSRLVSPVMANIFSNAKIFLSSGFGAGFAVSVVAAVAIGWLTSREASYIDVWLTTDQQATLRYERLDFAQAAGQFRDPQWKAMAQYRSGQYVEAAATWARTPDATGFYNRGNALMRGREYSKAITAYELAVAQAPDWQNARDNLDLARHVLAYIERAREQSDKGDQGEYGADDVVFDNTRERGRDIEITKESTLEAESAEKWMRSVDTKTADFLRSRFLLEASRSGEL
jgi:Ca-activated chloride channel family protein